MIIRAHLVNIVSSHCLIELPCILGVYAWPEQGLVFQTGLVQREDLCAAEAAGSVHLDISERVIRAAKPQYARVWHQFDVNCGACKIYYCSWNYKSFLAPVYFDTDFEWKY